MGVGAVKSCEITQYFRKRGNDEYCLSRGYAGRATDHCGNFAGTGDASRLSVLLNFPLTFVDDLLFGGSTVPSRLVSVCNTHPFNGPLSGTTQVSRYQKGETNLDFTEARDSEWQQHQLGHMQVCTSHQTDNHASTQFFTGRVPFLAPSQQRQSTELKAFVSVCNLVKNQWISMPFSLLDLGINATHKCVNFGHLA